MAIDAVRIDKSTATTNIADIEVKTLPGGNKLPVTAIYVNDLEVSGSNPFYTVVTNQPSTYAVTGTFWQNTQPVSGTVAISNFPGTQAVSGTFWQTTQPVSIAASVAVTGTFWQATQPVSLASLPALPAGTALIGKIGIDQTTPGTTEAVTVKPTGANAPVNRSTSVSYEASRLASSSAAVLFGLSGHNSSASGLFIQVHNSATAPADTTVPIELFYVPANSSFAFEAACQAGDTYSNGIYVCCSTTGPTKTIGGAVCWFNVRFR